MTDRWPSNLCPVSCSFGRSRNPSVQSGSGFYYAPARSRALWTCDCNFELPPADAVQFRAIMESMDGMIANYMIWDFANPYPRFASAISPARNDLVWTRGTSKFRWSRGAGRYYWSTSPISFTGPFLAVAAYAAGTTTIVLSGFATNSNVLVRGDLVEIDEYLYVIGANVLTDGSGNATITLMSGLVEATEIGEIANFTAPSARMRLDSVTWDEERSWDDALWRASAKFVEVAGTSGGTWLMDDNTTDNLADDGLEIFTE